MPVFELAGKHKPEFHALPEMVQGFIEAMFFTECCAARYRIANWFLRSTQRAVSEGQADGNLPNDCGFDELHPDSLAAIIRFVDQFEQAAKQYLDIAADLDGYDRERAGNDLWYTSQGHGVGFWSRDELELQLDELTLGEVIDRLCPRKEINPYFDNDGFVHVDI